MGEFLFGGAQNGLWVPLGFPFATKKLGGSQASPEVFEVLLWFRDGHFTRK